MLLLLITVLLSCSAFATPLREAQSFIDAWSRGDVAAAVAHWQPGRAARFRAVFQRETEIHCARVLRVALRPSFMQAATAAVDVDAVVERGTAGRVGEEHYVIDFRTTPEGWKVTGFERREERLADALMNAPVARRFELYAANRGLATPRLASALGRRAVLLTSRQRNREAEAFLEMARDVAGLTGSDVAWSAALAAESVHLRRNVEPGDRRPIEYAEEAERLALRSGDPDAVAGARVRLARAVEEGDLPRAETLLLSIVDRADSLLETVNVALAASQLTWMASDRNESGKSFRYALVASRHAELSGDPSARLNAAMTLAGAFSDSNDRELARIYLEKAVAVARESSAMVAELSLLGKLALLDGDDVDPGLLRRAHEVADCMGAPGNVYFTSLLLLGADAAIDRNDLEAAHAYLAEAHGLLIRTPIDERIHSGTLLTEAYALIRAQQPLEALEAVEEARIVLESRPELRSAAAWSGYAALALRMLGRHDEAIALLREGVEVIERDRSGRLVEIRARQSYFGRYSLHHTLVDLLVERGRNEEALVQADRRTARTLHDFVQLPAAARQPASPEIERAERAVVELNRTILSARPDEPALLVHRERLAAARLQLDDLRMRRAAATAPDPHDVPAALDLSGVAPGRAIVSYLVGRNWTTAFVVTQHEGGPCVTAYRVAAGYGELQMRVEALLDRIRARDSRYREHARALHDLLIAPLAGRLRGMERLSIVPDGPLGALPFQLLLDARGVPLLAHFELHYAPSVAWSLRGAAPARKPQSILALGDPEISGAGQAMFRSLVPGSTLGQLPDAAREAREVARLYPRSRVLTGTAADEASLKGEIARHDVVHLATHALIDESQPLYSGLVLATGGAQDDGLLEARELQSLDLDAELVVLSACSTARGRSYSGEGVVGLAWALLSRGVPQVVVSQWNADSKATTKLMIAFHRFLVAGDPPAAALRKAQLELRKDVRYEDPLYWAPFVVLGSSS
jgi:CHAT domain-containing protein/tetratricopeptide (TPR) repeat protein